MAKSPFWKQRIIRSLVTKNSLSLICLIETKKERFDNFLVQRLWPNMDYDFCFAPSSGASGGIICIWDKQWNTVSVRLISIYASNCAHERAAFWPSVLDLIVQDKICFLLGDFNEVLDPSERLNCTGFSQSMQLFSDFISASSLIESPLQGRFFTWKNSSSRSKIDRCFISADVMVEWPNCSLSGLPKNYSDHVPLLFRSEVKSDWGPKPFRSINVWWEHKDFESFVETSWENIKVTVSGDIVSKLREHRNLIKGWNTAVFGNLNGNLDVIHQDIHALESLADSSVLSDADVERLSSLHAESYRVSKQLESLWHQKSRVTWNLSGDRNTKFFHSIASVHSKSNFLSEITVDNFTVTKPMDVKAKIFEFYKNFFRRNSCAPFSLDSLALRSLSSSDASVLSLHFTEDEIFRTLLCCDDNKAPGPDGFNFFFYKKAWHILKFDILHIFYELHRTGTFPSGINTAFLVLIPKVRGASNISEFRPICLINGIFKLISKAQGEAFCFSKSFFDSSQLSVLVNGSPTKNFTMGKGVRQGGPLSSMLFVLAVEGLKALINEAVGLNLLEGVRIYNYAEPISILQFADDTLLFIPEDFEKIRNLLRVLRCFEIVSGLSINYQKSSILGINVDDVSLSTASTILNCSIEKFSITYLGLPLSTRPVTASL
ncbi:uncharacterized protein LOC126687838 [Mercurialis annua]|uniref:uncharacterized protein LOC126687838 n=1 Tax=Mercurialis annua TaxID=3986 RepID=UPI00215EA34D|nr:uncharacterized protein LOC126687838 [Mercurialis annua]